MDGLKWLDSRVLSLLELKEDLLFHKLSKDQINYYINESINLGQKAALDFKDKDIEEVLRKNKVNIKIDKSHKGKSLRLRAEIHFDNKRREIKIYENSIKQIYKVLRTFGMEITEKQVFQIHLAHEFYHFLEFKNGNYTNENLDKIICFSVGPLKRRSTILRTREIAAHGFCKEFLKLNFHPKLLDYIYLMEKDENYKEKLKEEIINLRLEYLN